MADDLRPRLVLRFGVTGHRPPRLSETDHSAIHDICAKVFQLAQATLAELHARHAAILSSQPPRSILATSLAEGADVVVAEAALECGMQITACLPFPAEIYARDFEPDRWIASERLIGRCESVLELGEQLGGSATAYEAAGRLVMSQSDILIAVWDGDPAQGPGGTAQIVAEAIAMHLPVIHVDPADSATPRLIWPGQENFDGELPQPGQDATEDFGTRLAALVKHLCAPPAAGESASLEAYLRSPLAIRSSAVAWPLLLAATGARKWRSTRFHIGGAGEAREWLVGRTAAFAGHGPFGDMLSGALLVRYGQADAEANRFAMRYRSTFLTNFAMAGLAVALALSSLLLPNLKLLLITLELVVIGLIMLNTKAGRQNNLHQCWLDRRQVAERLRMLVLTAPLGLLGLRAGEDGHAPPGWVHWYVRATARELGMPSGRIDEAYLRRARRDLVEFVDEQGSYHRGNAHTMAHADHTLHRTGDLLFFGTVLACFLFIATYVASGGHKVAIGGMGGAELVTFITALFPALAAALYGIRMQGDFAASSLRSGEIARRLRRLRSRIERDPPTYQRLVERGRAVREILLAEVQQWRSHYESRPLTLPG